MEELILELLNYTMALVLKSKIFKFLILAFFHWFLLYGIFIEKGEIVMDKQENMFGINLFEWEDWDDINYDLFQFYIVKWNFKSMKVFDKKTVSLSRQGKYEIYDDDSGIIIKSGYISEIPEFREEFKNRFL